MSHSIEPATLSVNNGNDDEDRDRRRVIVLNDDVSESVVDLIALKIFKFNEEDDEKERKQVGFDRSKAPIKVYINSYGGAVHDAFSAMSAIVSSKTPVHTIAMGKAMSAGFMILLAGHKRFCQKLSTLMYHQVAGWAVGKLQDIKQETMEMERLQSVADAFIVERTRIDPERLESVNRNRGEWYLDAETALKYGVVDEIL